MAGKTTDGNPPEQKHIMAGKTTGGGLLPLEETIDAGPQAVGDSLGGGSAPGGPDIGPIDESTDPISPDNAGQTIPAGPGDPKQSIGGVDFVPNQSDIKAEAALIPEGLGPFDTIYGVLTGIAEGKAAWEIAKEEGISTAVEYAIEKAVEVLFLEKRIPWHRETGGNDHPDAGVPGGTPIPGETIAEKAAEKAAENATTKAWFKSM